MSTSAERMRRLRERRLALLEPGDGQVPRAAEDLLLPAVETTIAALKLGERDQAVAQLARLYAGAIDEAQDQAAALRVFAPLLMKVLAALRATPLSRAGVKDAPRRPGPSRVAQLRAAHQATMAASSRTITRRLTHT